ncbi:TPA: hypothetical protein EYP75_02210 [Candidatus Bathyarchaeota archaeon]|nr:hypothetical protein [Candidatus Bathyarchaeota archaeon]
MSRMGLSVRSIRRSKPQIFEDVLRVVESGEYKPTRIMYKSNLSWRPLNKILNNMVNLGLIEEKNVKGHKYFFITQKGREFLELMDNLKRMLVPASFARYIEIDSLLSSPPKINGDYKDLQTNSLETVKLRIRTR